tara:strand:- start:2295 stop:2504 length:210 start_codon:yes stop_codon:yes gene_type:complete
LEIFWIVVLILTLKMLIYYLKVVSATFKATENLNFCTKRSIKKSTAQFLRMNNKGFFKLLKISNVPMVL